MQARAFCSVILWRMTRKDIVSLPNPQLRQRSQRVGVVNDEVRQLAESMMAATLDWEDHRKNEVGVALAAVQIGQLSRMVIVRANLKDKDQREFKVFINPEIVKKEGDLKAAPEG